MQKKCNKHRHCRACTKNATLCTVQAFNGSLHYYMHTNNLCICICLELLIIKICSLFTFELLTFYALTLNRLRYVAQTNVQVHVCMCVCMYVCVLSLVA